MKQREGQEDEGEMFRAGVWKVLLQEARNEEEGSKRLADSDGLGEYCAGTKRQKRGERRRFLFSSNSTHSAREF